MCNHPLPSRNIADYKPNYGMIEVLALQQQAPATAEVPAATSGISLTPLPPPNNLLEPQNLYVPGNFADVPDVPAARVGASNDTPPAATCELEALPRAGSEELAHLWPRIVAKYWIDAPATLSDRSSWEPWGVDPDGNVVFSGVILLI